MMFIRVFALITLLAGVLLTACGGDDTPAFDPAPGTLLDPPMDIPDFTLTGQTGEPFALSDLRGKVALLYFGYTFCPDVCPANMANYKRVKTLLGDDADRVAVVFISVDGARDTPDVLARYVTAFDPSFLGLTGDDAAIRPAAQAFGVFYQRTYPANTQADYLVTHTDKTFMLGRDGQLYLLYPGNTPADTLAAAARYLLRKTK